MYSLWTLVRLLDLNTRAGNLDTKVWVRLTTCVSLPMGLGRLLCIKPVHHSLQMVNVPDISMSVPEQSTVILLALQRHLQ